MEQKYISVTTNAGDENIPEYSDERNTLYTRNLVKTYGKRTVANNVSISVRHVRLWACWDLTVLARQPRST